MDDLKAVLKAGANARALGTAKGHNPFYKSDAMPAVTGDTVGQWQSRAEAWELGWLIEDLVREASNGE